MTTWIETARRAVRRRGWDVVRYNAQTNINVRRQGFLERLGIAGVFDIGANVGAYAAALRQFGYRGEIVSVEPTLDAFTELQRRAAGDPSWTARRQAVAGACGRRTVFVAANSVSSSLLARSSRLAAACPESCYVKEEAVEAVTLDRLVSEGPAPAWVKLDVQGSAAEILSAAKGSLDAVSALEIELPFVEMYTGEALSLAILEGLQRRGFELASLESNTFDPDRGTVLEVNAILIRRDAWEGPAR